VSSALIATVHNEAGTIHCWLEALAAQTAAPAEFVIVDGGSTDGTVAAINSHRWPDGFPPPRVIVQRCNIAEGRNIAIRNCTAPIIASLDAGSVPDLKWFGEITGPLVEDARVDVVGGVCRNSVGNDFQRKLARYSEADESTSPEPAMPSSRNVAFRLTAWEAVGGYPEWLTLTAEDALFNHNLRMAGFNFQCQPTAIVHWEGRPDMKSYLKMMYRYGYGSAEAGLAKELYLRWLLSVAVPPLILFSPRPLRDAPFRYARNAAAALGWLAGLAWGRKPPAGWKIINGVPVSPEAQHHLDAAGSKQ
jgi:glycosyltransferase involved in cell wall biosynthesis